jgi:hypothetical protein
MVKTPEAPVYVNALRGPQLQTQWTARKSASDNFNLFQYHRCLAAVTSPHAMNGPLRIPLSTLP